MTEESYFWDGHVTGDATKAPYSSLRFAHFMSVLLNGDRTLQGPIGDYENELEVTGSSSPVSVNTGAALITGRLYENFNALSIDIPMPAFWTRIDVIALEMNVNTQTIRAVRVPGIEGGGAPAMIQSAAVWQVALYQAAIDTVGTIVLTDVRTFVRTRLAPGYEHKALTVGDGLHTATAWNDVGTGAGIVQVTLTAGTWWIVGHLTTEAGPSSDNRGIRLYDSTSAVSLASSFGYVPSTFKGNLSVQTVVTITATNVVKLQFYAVDTTDIVHAVVASGTTKLTALRVA